MKHFNIPIFVPHLGCPFDCIFCNQKHITGIKSRVNAIEVKNIIDEQLSTISHENSFIEVAFFGGSFTGIQEDVQCELLSIAYQYLRQRKIDGIRISTRPDYIDEEILDRLQKFGVTTIELGVQSLDEDVLKFSNRGHSIKDVENAVSLIKKYPFKLGLQMMTGLPMDTNQKAIDTANKIISLNPDFVRIYPTLVVKDTYLEKLYQRGEYQPQTLDEAVFLCKELMKLFNKVNIPIIRIALMTTDEISPNGLVVAGPFHSAFRELVESAIYYDKIEKALEKYKENNAIIIVNDKEISKAIGNKRVNIDKIFNKFGIRLKIKGEKYIEKGKIAVLTIS